MRPVFSLVVCGFLLVALVTAQPASPAKPQLVVDAGGHTDIVRRVLYTPGGKLLIAVSHDKTVRTWDAVTGEPTRIIRLPSGPGDEGSLWSAAVAPDGRSLVVAGMPIGRGKFGVPIYSVSLASGLLLKVYKGHENAITSLAYSKEGARFASSSADKTVRVWDVRTGQTVQILKGHTDAVRQVVFSPDGLQLATVGLDNTAKVWSLKTGKADITMQGGKQRLNCIAWSPDGKTIATGNAETSITLWDTSGKQRKLISDLKGPVLSLAFSPNSQELLYTGAPLPKGEFAPSAGIVDVAAGKERLTFTKHNNTVVHGSFAPDGKTVITTGGDDNEIYVWKIVDGSVVHKLVGKGQTPWSVAWSADGMSVGWSTDNENRVLTRSFRVEDLEIGEKPGTGYTGAVATQGDWSLAQAKTGELVALQNKKVIHAIDLKSPAERVYSYSWLGERAVVGTTRALYLVDPKANRVVRKFVGHTTQVMAVAPSPDGKHFASGGADQTIRIWDPEREEPLVSFFVAGDDWVGWTPEGYYAASANGEELIGFVTDLGTERLPNFWPVSRFRASLYQPEVVKKVVPGGGANKVLIALGKKPTDISNLANLLPPQVTITSPAPPSGGGPIQHAKDTEKLEVQVSAKSLSSYSLESVRLLVNGRPYKGQAGIERITPPKVGPVSVSWKLELSPGTYSIAAVAQTRVSRSVSPAVEVVVGGVDPLPPALYVLAVGISDYPGSLKLRFSAADAELIAKTFKEKCGKQFGKVETKVITNKQATRKEIMAGLTWLQQSMKRRDLAVVHFSGHGSQERDGQYLIPVDVNPLAVPATSISSEALKNALGELPGQVLFIMDACHSGAVAENKRRAFLDDLARDLISEDYGVIVLCSSTGQEVSLEGSNVKNGYFTAAIVEGLSGKADLNKDGTIFLNELEGYAAKRTRELSRGIQNPIFAKPPNVPWFALVK